MRDFQKKIGIGFKTNSHNKGAVDNLDEIISILDDYPRIPRSELSSR